MSKSKTESIVDLINNSYLCEFDGKETRALDQLGCFNESNKLMKAARLQLRGGSAEIIVGSPFVLADGLIQAYTPCERESSMVFQVDAIDGIFFTSD